MKAIAQTLQKVAVKGGLGACQPIMNPKPVLSSFHQSRSPQVTQVTRSSRLRDLQNLYQVSNAHLTARQKTKDPESGTVRKCPENQVDLCFALFHYIRPRESNTRKRTKQDPNCRPQMHGQSRRCGLSSLIARPTWLLAPPLDSAMGNTSDSGVRLPPARSIQEPRRAAR